MDARPQKGTGPRLRLVFGRSGGPDGPGEPGGSEEKVDLPASREEVEASRPGHGQNQEDRPTRHRQGRTRGGEANDRQDRETSGVHGRRTARSTSRAASAGRRGTGAAAPPVPRGTVLPEWKAAHYALLGGQPPALKPAAAGQGPENGRHQRQALPSLAAGTGGGASVPHIVQQGQTLGQLAGLYGIPLERLIRTNSEVDDPDLVFAGQSLRIPLTEPVLPPVQRLFIEYVVRPGDTLESIAGLFNTTLPALEAANPRIDPDLIFPGQVVYIPTAQDPPPPPLEAVLYVVQPGDTLTGIAGRFGVDLGALTGANPQVVDLDVIQAGEILVVPVGIAPPEPPVFTLGRYVVQPGDTLASIATQFNVTLSALQEANLLAAAIPGLVLVIPLPIAVPEPPPAPPGFIPCRPAPFGRRVELGDDDFELVPFPTGFTFPFFDLTVIDGVFVNSNGSLTFGAGDPSFFPTTDDFLEGPPRIAPLWVDLFPPGGPPAGGVFVDFEDTPEGRRLVVTWDRVPYFFTEEFNTIQALLLEDGRIQFCYFQLAPLPSELLRVLVGVARGEGIFAANIFRYDEGGNPRRVFDPAEPTPDGSLSGRLLLYTFDPQVGNYRLSFT